MRFHSLRVENLRAVRLFEIEDLGSFVVIAGPNGCGKSCVLDAIRLLKSVYGGYAANEYHNWFSEFAINLADRSALQKLFRDPTRPVEIEATLSFSGSELAYVREHLDDLLQPVAFQQVTGQPVDYWGLSRIAMATQLRHIQPQIEAAVQALRLDLDSALDDPVHTIALTIMPSGQIFTRDCRPAEVILQTYEPRHLGVIEYHSASRSYSRQQVAGINLDARAFEDQRRQQRLYNAQAKYQNVKTELATSYLRSLIAEASGANSETDDLNASLQELFTTFFPDKTYLGASPQAGGTLEFPVQLRSGEVHDIDELSSGEKEILYGYLELRNSTPPGSVLLLDEPELHLNPGLLQGFADFYYRHLGVAHGSQVWLITHSDTLLRQAVGNSNYRVFHMLSAVSTSAPENQAAEVLAANDVERVVLDLVGDLATYQPHGKVVLLEGGGDSRTDVMIVRRLFPELVRRLNLVSAGDRRRVADLYASLHDAASQAGIPNRFFAIVDRDRTPLDPAETTVLSWDVYHIENYLLDPPSVRRASNALLSGDEQFETDEDVLVVLRECAEESVSGQVMELLQAEVNRRLIESIAVGGPPNSPDPAGSLVPSIVGSVERLNRTASELTVDAVALMADDYRLQLMSALDADAWLKDFPGRPILKRFVDRVFRGKLAYPLFVNSVLDKMAEGAVQPFGMSKVLKQVLDA